MTSPDGDEQSLQDEIADLERRLEDAKSRLKGAPAPPKSASEHPTQALHTLLLLSDSALPLGSFAFSSGLESFLAHHRHDRSAPSQLLHQFPKFLQLSLSTLASTALPYVITAYREPVRLPELDDAFDASTPCTVARRASVAQGKALLSVWERSFRGQHKPGCDGKTDDEASVEAIGTLVSFSRELRSASAATNGFPSANGHLAPLWGAVTRIMGIPLHSAAYVFLFAHARTVVSAAVRASVMGPYQAQGVLAAQQLQEQIDALVKEIWERPVEEAGQSVPVMDLWVGRHELLYSRIFNS